MVRGKKIQDTAEPAAVVQDTGKAEEAVNKQPVRPQRQSQHFAPVHSPAPVVDHGSWNQQGIADEEAMKEIPGAAKFMAPSAPGRMAMRARVSLHTHLAINIFRGRKADPANKVPPIIGLARFARQVAGVWSAAAQDDPYADLCLLEIEAAYKEAKEVLDRRTAKLNELLTGLEDFVIEIQTSVKPTELLLEFNCPWSYQGVFLLRQYDRLIRLGMTARHTGMMDGGEWETVIIDAGRLVRHVFAQVNRWVNTGVTRADIELGTQAAQRAASMYVNHARGYAKLPESVFLGLERAELSPPNRKLGELLQRRLEAAKATGGVVAETEAKESNA